MSNEAVARVQLEVISSADLLTALPLVFHASGAPGVPRGSHMAARSITSRGHLHDLLLELQRPGLVREIHQELAGDPLFAGFHI